MSKSRRRSTSLRKHRSRQRKKKLLAAAALGGVAIGGLIGAGVQQARIWKLKQMLGPLEKARENMEANLKKVQDNYNQLKDSFEKYQTKQQELIQGVAQAGQALQDELNTLRAENAKLKAAKPG